MQRLIDQLNQLAQVLRRLPSKKPEIFPSFAYKRNEQELSLANSIYAGERIRLTVRGKTEQLYLLVYSSTERPVAFAQYHETGLWGYLQDRKGNHALFYETLSNSNPRLSCVWVPSKENGQAILVKIVYDRGEGKEAIYRYDPETDCFPGWLTGSMAVPGTLSPADPFCELPLPTGTVLPPLTFAYGEKLRELLSTFPYGQVLAEIEASEEAKSQKQKRHEEHRPETARPAAPSPQPSWKEALAKLLLDSSDTP